MKRILVTYLVLIPVVVFAQNSQKINVSVSAYREMLPSTFQLDSIYEVKRVEAIDLDGDSLKDKVITWQKKSMPEGDTIFTSIFFKKDTSEIFFKTLANLYTLDFSYWSSKSAGSDILDSLKELYIESNYGMVEFSVRKIIIGIATSSFDGCDFHFIFDDKKRNWYLKQQQCWNGWYYNQRELGKLQSVSNSIPIEDFNILKILGY